MAGDWLGAVGSLAGGLVNGAFSMAGANMNSQAVKEANERNLAYADYYNNNKIQMLVADAKKAGVSPYAVLGSAGGSMSPNLIADTSKGDALGKVGDAMQNALVNATFDKIDTDSKMDDLNIQMKELEIEEMKQRIAKEKASFDTTGGSGSGLSSAEDYWVPYKMPDGSFVMKPNQNLTDMQSENMAEYIGGTTENFFSSEAQRKRLQEHLIKGGFFDPKKDVIYKYLTPLGWKFKAVPKEVGYWEALDYQPKNKKKPLGGNGSDKKGDKILKMTIEK